MARKVKAANKAERKVRFIEVQARPLVTVGVGTGREHEGLRNCIVRVRALPGDEPGAAAAFATKLREDGVLAVKVEQAPTSPSVVIRAPEPKARLRARFVVERMIGELPGAVDKEALSELVGKMMDEEGI